MSLICNSNGQKADRLKNFTRFYMALGGFVNTVLPRLERPSRLVRHTEYYAPILKEQRKSAPSRSVRPNEKNISVQPLKVAGIILNFIKASLRDDFLPH